VVFVADDWFCDNFHLRRSVVFVADEWRCEDSEGRSPEIFMNHNIQTNNDHYNQHQIFVKLKDILL
jgi:hypothetical protein